VKFSELEGRTVAVWGLGRETLAFQDQLAQRLPSARINFVIDDDTPAADAEGAIAAADVLVRSPGVSIYKPLIQDAVRNGKTVTTATALWLAERGGRHVIGVTGTKGKSTTATVIAHLLRQVTATELAGNIGRPVIDLLDTPEETWVVCELSSYQIADLTTGPEVAVLTNLYREHTDWHGSEERYRADKLRIFELPGVRIAVRAPGGSGDWPLVVAPDQIPLRGRHNAANVAAAAAAIEAAGLSLPPLPQALEGLTALPHRLQTVHTGEQGTEWVDDSISTTPESAIAALEVFNDRPVVLIAGGSDRDQDYDGLGRALAGRTVATALIHLPDTGPRIAAAAAAHGFLSKLSHPARDMADAIAIAAEISAHGGVILMSPAAPSFNAYTSFEERGDDFAARAKSVALRA
jgi:UDP-N-acetylmuramoyl-L-alanine---L-glutamate ligase